MTYGYAMNGYDRFWVRVNNERIRKKQKTNGARGRQRWMRKWAKWEWRKVRERERNETKHYVILVTCQTYNYKMYKSAKKWTVDLLPCHCKMDKDSIRCVRNQIQMFLVFAIAISIVLTVSPLTLSSLRKRWESEVRVVFSCRTISTIVTGLKCLCM